MTRPTPQRRQALVELARTQDTLFTVAQARHLGFAHTTVARWLETGRCRTWHPSVLSDSAVPATWRRWLRAAQLHAGPSTIITGEAAGRLHGLDVSRPTPIEIAVPRTHAIRLAGVAVHRPRRLPRSMTIDGLVVATVAPTILALAATRDVRAIEDLATDAIRRRMTTIDALVAAMDDVGQNVVGRGRFRLVVERLRDDRDGASPRAHGVGRRSPLETAFAHLVTRFGLPEPIWGRRIEVAGRGIELDALFEDHGVAVELDGYRFHASPGELQRDSERQNLIMLAGLAVLRFTHTDVTRNPAGTASLLRNMLR